MPFLGSASFSIGKFFLHSNFCPCCCPAALIFSLPFLGSLGVNLLSLPPEDCAWGVGPGGGAGLGISSSAQSYWGRRASALGGQPLMHTHTGSPVSSGSPWPTEGSMLAVTDFWPCLRPGGALSPWSGGADRHPMGGQRCLLGRGWAQSSSRSHLGMSSMEGLPPRLAVPSAPSPCPFLAQGANPEGAQWAKPLRRPLRPGSPSAS